MEADPPPDCPPFRSREAKPAADCAPFCSREVNPSADRPPFRCVEVKPPPDRPSFRDLEPKPSASVTGLPTRPNSLFGQLVNSAQTLVPQEFPMQPTAWTVLFESVGYRIRR